MNKALPIIIVLCALVLSISSFWDDSLIVDEIPHVGAGYSYVKNFDFRLNPEHPPLAKILAAVPLLFLDIKQEAFGTRFWQDDINGQWDFGRSLIFQTGNNAELITKLVKFPILLFFILSSILIWFWTKKLYGSLAGIFALILFCFSPTIIAHSRLVTTDLAALFGVLISSFYFFHYLENPSTKNLWLSGIAIGIAMLTKFSLFLLIPYFAVMALIFAVIRKKSTWRFILKTIFIFIIGFTVIVWPIYAIFTLNYPSERQHNDTKFILESYGNRKFADPIVFLSDKPIIRGFSHYGLGLLMVTQRTIGGNTAYFLGEVSNQAWKHYFPVVYAIKEPLAWFILLALILLVLPFLYRKADKDNKKNAPRKLIKNFVFSAENWLKNHFMEFSMITWIAIYWITSIESNLNIGVRHLLPVYPFMIMLISGQLDSLYRKIRVISYKFKKLLITYNFLLITLLGWYIYENIKVWPYYLTYFNQAAGGPSGGYRYVVDSNLDWGQDLKRLSEWVNNNNIDTIHLDYFGWSDPAYYLNEKFVSLHAGQYKSAEEFLRQNPKGGYIVISASFYMGSRENLETSYLWLDSYKPLVIIGNSIFIWKF